MAFATIHYNSRALKKASSFNVIFPDDSAISQPWAVYYLLHGLSDDHTTWMRRTSIERFVLDLPLVVVMPDGGRGWYTNAVSAGGHAYEDDLIKDIVGLVDRTFPVKAERSGRAIGGLSMGGYGAIKLGLKYPKLFASVNSHSGVISLPRRDPTEANALSPEFSMIFGDNAKGGPEDPFAQIEAMKPKNIPAMWIDCGAEDPFLEDNRTFHQHLESLKMPHEYQEFPGTHDWAYWDTHVQDAIAFHVKNLGLKRL